MASMEKDKWEIPGFKILHELGRGGSAVVFLAEKPDSSKVALKIFHSPLSSQADSKRRILSELNAASSSKSANIIRVHDLLEVNGHPVLVMDYVEGSALSDFQSRLPYVLPEISVLIIIEILKTLEDVHSRGIIHRDMKPSNILVDSNGKIYVTDFGLAKWTDASTHTHHGMILGSPDFMSPEQAQGDIVTESSDLFSLTSILYFLVTGTRPFSRPSPLAVLAAVIKGDFEPAHRRNPKISPALSRIIQKGLSRNPKDRFASAEEFRETLESYFLDLGLNENTFCFSRWIKDSSGETMQALRLLSESLAKHGRRAIDKKSWDRATEIVSHLSLVAPDSQALKQLVDELDSSRHRNGWIYWSAGIACSLILFAGGLHLLSSFNKKQINETVKTISSAPITSNNQAPESLNRSPAIIAPPIVAEVNIPPQKPKPRKIKEQWVRFEIPADVEVEWNGKNIDSTKPLKAKPGVYSVVLRKKGFQAIQREVEVKASEITEIKVN